jgi:hypothetical protein
MKKDDPEAHYRTFPYGGSQRTPWLLVKPGHTKKHIFHTNCLQATGGPEIVGHSPSCLWIGKMNGYFDCAGLISKGSLWAAYR